jgi:hypothetical protein
VVLRSGGCPKFMPGTGTVHSISRHIMSFEHGFEAFFGRQHGLGIALLVFAFLFPLGSVLGILLRWYAAPGILMNRARKGRQLLKDD